MKRVMTVWVDEITNEFQVDYAPFYREDLHATWAMDLRTELLYECERLESEALTFYNRIHEDTSRIRR